MLAFAPTVNVCLWFWFLSGNILQAGTCSLVSCLRAPWFMDHMVWFEPVEPEPLYVCTLELESEIITFVNFTYLFV